MMSQPATVLQVLCGSESGTLLLWDGENLAATVYGGNGKACHEGSIEILHYCEESKQVVTGGSDGCDKQQSLQKHSDSLLLLQSQRFLLLSNWF